jgi:hypothetical protein
VQFLKNSLTQHQKKQEELYMKRLIHTPVLAQNPTLESKKKK